MSFEIPILVAVIIAFNEFLKKQGVSKTIIPIVSIVLGIVCSFFFVPADTIQVSIFIGVVLGLSANGLFDVTKISKYFAQKELKK